MRIAFLTLNYAPEPIGIGPYSTGTAEWLAAAGHDVQVIAGKPYYPGWKVEPAWRGGLWRKTVENGVRVTRCAHYVPQNPGGAKRLLHHATFVLTAMGAMLRHMVSRKNRPDLVLAVAPAMMAVPVAAMAARLAGAPLWLHVQDFEVEAARATGLLSETGFISRIAMRIERRIFESADRVSTISPAMRQKLHDKGVATTDSYEFRNWADITAIAPLAGPSRYRKTWSIEAPYVALYSGNIANKQGIEIVLEAARLLAHRRDLRFVVCGNGPNRERLAAMGQDLPNITFHDLQPRENLSELLGLATVHLLPQIAGAADLVLPSKLTNMLASGVPVVATADAGTGLANEVAGAGLVTPPGDAGAFAAAIERLLDEPGLASDLGTNARRKAVEGWEKSSILTALTRQLEALAHRTGTTGET